MFLGLIFPKQCIGCNTYDVVACIDCLSKNVSPTYEDSVLTLGAYAHPFWKHLIEQLKFHGIRELSLSAGQLLAQILQQTYVFPSSTWIVPIPLHTKRLRERGYNQSLLIAEVMSDTLQFPVVEILKRIKYTRPQSSQHIQKRYTNVAHAFVNISTVLPSPELIILVDDVYTTGATIQEAIAALRLQYTSQIIVAAIARGG